MTESVLVSIKDVSKKYGRFLALDGVNITIEKGKIYGFIGENGAGKTTLIRLLAGLSLPSRGAIEAFGMPMTTSAEAIRKRIGFMVEHPIYHDNMSAADNLKMQALLYGKKLDNIPALLERVGLKDVGKRRLKDFSMGMKQRLGIAMALANNPDLLVLDEPVNGLDPVGMVDVRHLLQKLSHEGITIFLSSHILTELYQLATDYIIIHQGKIIKTMSLEELNQVCQKSLRVRASDPKAFSEGMRTQ